MAVIGAGLIAGDPFQRTVVAGLARLFPSRRIAILTRWQRLLAHFILRSARTLGGAHIQPPPAIPGEAGVLVLMNHQSVLDIPLVVAALPIHPRIVTRERYAHGKPIISHMVRLYQYPLVEPTATVRMQLRSVEQAARESPVPIVLYPEGTRTRDGSLGRWREGALRAILGARQWTVYLLVADGFWQTARLTDFMKDVSSIDSRSAVVGPFVGPEPGADPGPFIAELRVRMVAALAGLRSGAMGQ